MTFYASSSFAATPICPPSIKIASSIVGPIPGGWQQLPIEVSHNLNNVGFLSGNLIDNGELEPEELEIAPFIKDAWWTFTADETTLWISCSYTNTPMQLFTKLPPGTSSCRMIYNDANTNVLDISCALGH